MKFGDITTTEQTMRSKSRIPSDIVERPGEAASIRQESTLNMCMGYALHTGGGSKRDLVVADVDGLQDNDASEVSVKKK